VAPDVQSRPTETRIYDPIPVAGRTACAPRMATPVFGDAERAAPLQLLVLAKPKGVARQSPLPKNRPVIALKAQDEFDGLRDVFRNPHPFLRFLLLRSDQNGRFDTGSNPSLNV
jgi:hypothetical protein